MNFDFVARHYWWLERIVFGSALQRCRTALIPNVANCKRALTIGEGDGRFIAELIRQNPSISADIVESSTEMRQLTLRRTSFSPRLRFIDEPGSGYDLIVTNFFLDTLTDEDCRDLIVGLQERSPQARWIVSEFNPASLPTRLLVKTMYSFFRATAGLEVNTIPRYRDALRNAGYRLELSWSTWRGFIVSELWTPRS